MANSNNSPFYSINFNHSIINILINNNIISITAIVKYLSTWATCTFPIRLL